MSEDGSAPAVDLLTPLLEPLDIGFGELPAYNYLIAVLVILLISILHTRNQNAIEAARRRQEEEERSKRVLERPIDPKRTFTNEQLKVYDGTNPVSPIYMSVKGIVFDVTSGEAFYGPGAGYAPLAGRESARALAKMETKEFDTNLADLGAYERQTLEDWFDRFDSKYPRVGTLIGWVDTLTGTKPPIKPRKSAAAAAGGGINPALVGAAAAASKAAAATAASAAAADTPIASATAASSAPATAAAATATATATA